MGNDIIKSIENYYSEKITKYGAIPAGVDWNGEESQLLRFKILCDLFTRVNFFSLNDLGCGYGKLIDYLKENHLHFKYRGYDFSQEMIDNAVNKYSKIPEVSFYKIDCKREMYVSDYTVASGIFNVKMDYTEADWLSYILSTIDEMHNKSNLGFSFNLLTKYSDSECMKNSLYYADPCFFFDYCKRNYSRNIALLHNYDLYEFTVHVKKD